MAHFVPDNDHSPAGAGDTYTGGGWKSHGILAVLFLIYMSDYADRMVLSSMINFIQRDWDITDGQAGMLLSVVLVFITIFSPAASILVDRWSRRKMIAIMTLLWSLATLACKFATGYYQLLVARAFIGLGEAGYASGGAALLSGAYPEKKRGIVFGIFNAAIPVGIGIGLIAGGQIASRWHWQDAFGIVAIPGVILALIAWFLPDYKTVHPEHKGVPARTVYSDLRYLFKISSLVFIYLGFAMAVSCTTAMAHWMAPYFERTGLAEMGKGGTYATPLMALVILGAPLGGIVADRWQKSRPDARLIMPVITMTISGVALWIAMQYEGSSAQLGILAVYGLSVTMFIAPSLAASQDVVHPGFRALAMGMCVFLQHALGDIWSPSIVGLLSDFFGESGLSKALMFVPIYCILAALFFYLASRHYVEDLSKVERVKLEAEENN